MRPQKNGKGTLKFLSKRKRTFIESIEFREFGESDKSLLFSGLAKKTRLINTMEM